MRKLITLSIITILILTLLVACSQDKKVDSTPVTTTEEKTTNIHESPKSLSREEKISLARSAAESYILNVEYASPIKEIKLTNEIVMSSYPTQVRFRGYYTRKAFLEATYTFKIEVEVDNYGNCKIISYEKKLS